MDEWLRDFEENEEELKNLSKQKLVEKLGMKIFLKQ
jgi:hypothetical protein